MKILSAAACYFAIVFGVGLLVGPIRVIWLEPWFGTTIAVLCELPILVIAMVIAARWVPTRVGLSTDLGSLASMGIIALILQQIADFTVGMSLRAIPATEQLAYLMTPAGLIYGAALLAFAAMPTLVVLVARLIR